MASNTTSDPKAQRDLFVAASPKDSDVNPDEVVGRSEGHGVGYYGYNPDEVPRDEYTFAGAAAALREKNAAGGEKSDTSRTVSPQSSSK